MSHQTYFRVSGFIFLAIAVLHLWRIVNNLPIVFGTTTISVGVSWVGVIIAGYLAYHGLKRR